MSQPSAAARWRRDAYLLLALMLLQAPLWLNPGYFSHDELQWAARAAHPLDELHFLSFTDWGSFQFRPLTFNLWLLLSNALFETPRLMHALFVLLGSLNALLLAAVLRRAGARDRAAAGAAMVFALSPFAVWVHGWVACLADLIWVGAGLITVALLQRLGSDTRSVLLALTVAGLATVVGLYAKEAALVLPALMGLAWLLLGRPRVWMAATVGSGVVALIYLVLRLDVLMQPETGSTYTTDIWAVPYRWLEYQVFPWALNVSEIHVLTLASSGRWWAAVLVLSALAWCVWRASRRLWVAWAGGGVLALGPVLLLPMSANQYGYGFSALACGVLALAWPAFLRGQMKVMWLLMGLTVLHGFQVQAHVFRVGKVQAVFSPALADILQEQSEAELRLWPERAKQRFIYARLTHDIPSYRGVRLGARVSLVAGIDEATHRIAPDGSLHSLEARH